MMNLERIDYIWKEVQDKKAVSVAQLAGKYFVSPSTIRRDMADLERQGLVRRTYGGCVLVERESSEIPFLVRKGENQAAKDTICRLAAGLVRDEMVLFLDTTTTAAAMADWLTTRKNLKVITTNAQTALNCLDKLSGENMRVSCTGGVLNGVTRGFTGETARRCIEQNYADCLFFSCRAVSCDRGLMDVSEEDVTLKQSMLQNARIRVLLADSSKLDTYSYLRIDGFENIEYLITEKKPRNIEQWEDTLKPYGVRLVYPEA